jgi:hypothetical protein
LSIARILKYLFKEVPYVLEKYKNEKYKNTTEVTKELFLLLPMNISMIEINQELKNEN